MTRSFVSTRKPRPTAVRAPRRGHAGVTPLPFRFFRLVSILDPGPGEPDFTSIELCSAPRQMRAFG